MNHFQIGTLLYYTYIIVIILLIIYCIYLLYESNDINQHKRTIENDGYIVLNIPINKMY
jgi:hypothetical protein